MVRRELGGARCLFFTSQQAKTALPKCSWSDTDMSGIKARTEDLVSKTAPQNRSPWSGMRLVVPIVSRRTGAFRDVGIMMM